MCLFHHILACTTCTSSPTANEMQILSEYECHGSVLVLQRITIHCGKFSRHEELCHATMPQLIPTKEHIYKLIQWPFKIWRYDSRAPAHLSVASATGNHHLNHLLCHRLHQFQHVALALPEKDLALKKAYYRSNEEIRKIQCGSYTKFRSSEPWFLQCKHHFHCNKQWNKLLAVLMVLW